MDIIKNNLARIKKKMHDGELFYVHKSEINKRCQSQIDFEKLYDDGNYKLPCM